MLVNITTVNPAKWDALCNKNAIALQTVQEWRLSSAVDFTIAFTTENVTHLLIAMSKVHRTVSI